LLLPVGSIETPSFGAATCPLEQMTLRCVVCDYSWATSY
jgi:hypothetical protein